MSSSSILINGQKRLGIKGIADTKTIYVYEIFFVGRPKFIVMFKRGSGYDRIAKAHIFHLAELYGPLHYIFGKR